MATKNLGKVVGKSAYELALSNGFTGTEVEYLASLKGEQGEQGVKGDKGDKGDTGAQGEKGEAGTGGASYEVLTSTSLENGVSLEDNKIYTVDSPVNSVVLNGAIGKGMLRFETSTALTPVFNNIAVKSSPSSYEANKFYDLEYFNNAISVSNGFSFPITPSTGQKKILVLSNSFGVDANEYADSMAKSAGVDVVLGVAYRGSGSMKNHYDYMISGAANYTFYIKDTIEGDSIRNTQTLEQTITAYDWDIIVLQSVSGESGMYDRNAPYIQPVIDYAKEKCSNKNVRFMWHQTWAYAKDSTHSSYPNYNNDQTEMYNAINDCSSEILANFSDIESVIPNGTSIQNCRTSNVLNALDDELTRDGFHLGYETGRVIASYTYICSVLDIPLSSVKLATSDLPSSWTSEYDALARQGIESALTNKFQLTYIDEPVTPPAVDKTELQATVSSVSSLVEADYTTDSWASMQQALAAANTVLQDNDATQVEVDAENSNLATAITNLEEVSETPEPSGFVEFTDYTVVQGFCSAWASGSLIIQTVNTDTEAVTSTYKDSLSTPETEVIGVASTVQKQYLISKRPLSLPAGSKIEVLEAIGTRLSTGTSIATGTRGASLTGIRTYEITEDSVVALNTASGVTSFQDPSSLRGLLDSKIKILVPAAKISQASSNEV